MSYPLQFLISFITTLGFSYFFQVRRRALLSASFAGAMGWVLCAYCVDHGMSLIFANFFAALLIAFLAEIFARFEKNPVTIYIVPGILPLVPGFRIYYMMNFFVEGNLEAGIEQGISAFFIALALALGIIAISAFAKILFPAPPIVRYKKEELS